MNRSIGLFALLASCGTGVDSDQPAEWLKVGTTVVVPGIDSEAPTGAFVGAVYAAPQAETFDRCRPELMRIQPYYGPNPVFGLNTETLRETPGWRVAVMWTPRPMELVSQPGDRLETLPALPGDRYWESEYLSGSPCDPMPNDGRPCFMGNFALRAVLTSTITEPCP